MKKTITIILITLLFGCTNMTNENSGALIGAAVGGAAGHNFGSGTGKVLATFGGALVGAFVGSNIGAHLDRYDELQAQRALENTRTGQTTSWRNPDDGHKVTVQPTATFQNSSGRYCREFRSRVEVGYDIEEAYGTACRQPDGTWEIQ